MIKHMARTVFQSSGTCKMGCKLDKTAVVDPQLKVHGVVDESIMPEITSGNTNAPCIMIGEMESDFIKKDWLKN